MRAPMIKYEIIPTKSLSKQRRRDAVEREEEGERRGKKIQQ